MMRNARHAPDPQRKRFNKGIYKFKRTIRAHCIPIFIEYRLTCTRVFVFTASAQQQCVCALVALSWTFLLVELVTVTVQLTIYTFRMKAR